MKKLIFAVVFLVAGAVNAQQPDFGAKAGVNFATLDSDGPFEMSGQTGFHFGLVAELKFSEKFSFQPEVLYSIQGANAEFSMEGFGSAEETLRLDYVNIPLMAKFYMIPGLSLEVGPQIGVLVKAESEYEYSFGEETEAGTGDIKDETKAIDFALAGGLAYEFPMGIFVSGRYNLGLSNVADSSEELGDEFEEDFKWKNNVIQLSLGYKF